MKVLIAGGHLTPALAVIEKLNKNEVFYVGRKHAFEGEDAVSLEYQEITRLGIPFFELKTGRLQRKITRYTLISLLKLPPGFLHAHRILKFVKPDVVLCFGSYVSVPVGIVAKLMKIPLVIHEQTLEAGFANTILSNFADKICISFKTSEKYFPKSKIVLTGNPLRTSVISQKKTVPQKNQLYISGGSLGSHRINQLVEESLKKLLTKFSITHQAGDSRKYQDYERVLTLKHSLGGKLSNRYKLVKFLSPDESSDEMAKACLFIGRSGINTVSELIYLEKPALLIPLAFSQRNEQLKNAQHLQNLGLGEVCREEDLNPEKFYRQILAMNDNLDKYKLTKTSSENEASSKILKILQDVCQQKNP